MPKIRLAPHNGAPTLFIDDKPVYPAEFYPEGKDDIHLTAGMGLHIYHLYSNDIFTEDRYNAGYGPNARYDFSGTEEHLLKILDDDPKALFHIRLVINAPEWWCKTHPEECNLLENGEHYAQSFASEAWLRDACNLLKGYVHHLRTTGIGERVVAYLPCAAPWHEWGTYDAMYDLCSDYSEPMRQHFRRWLREKYKDDSTLRQVWNIEEVSLETAEVPPPEVQRETHIRHFRDPRRARWALDYFECFNELIAEDIICVCRAIKEACDYENLVGVFYGYLMEMSWNAGFFYRNAPPNVPAYIRSGHLAVRKLLKSDVVDLFSSPLSYQFRHVGGDAPFMTVHDSIKAHNKLYLAEDDSRDHRIGITDQNYGAPKTAPEMVSIFRRNFINALCRSSGIWWMNHCTSILDESILASLHDCWRVGQASMQMNRASASEIAVVIDEHSLLYEGFSKAYDWSGIYLQRIFGLARLGAPHDVWLLDDVVGGLAPSYKMYLFLNPFCMSKDQRDRLRTHVMQGGATIVWGYASGITDGQTFDPTLMTDLTGIQFSMEDLAWGCEAVITNFRHPITENLPNNTHWGTPADLGPLFEVVDSDATILGIIVGGNGRCEPGVVIKEMGDWKSLYVGAPNIPSNVLRAIARYAGVHVYCEHDDVFYANHSFVGLHTLKGQEKCIVLPEARPVFEVFGRRQLAQMPVTQFMDVVDAGETRLYYLGLGKDLGFA